jgi:hypothetical protein
MTASDEEGTLDFIGVQVDPHGWSDVAGGLPTPLAPTTEVRLSSKKAAEFVVKPLSVSANDQTRPPLWSAPIARPSNDAQAGHRARRHDAIEDGLKPGER